VTGVLKGVSAVFFAYIGFDAISTTAENARIHSGIYRVV
jgi:amino acid transporter